MAIAKGRKIVVGGVEYQWKATGRYDVNLTIACQSTGKKITHQYHSKSLAVKPSMVREMIEARKAELVR
jgi:hypothetical protein